jgi:DNA-binding transcriptional LysR family regulator
MLGAQPDGCAPFHESHKGQAAMNLRRIECFLAVVDFGTVTAAAPQLHMAQPALSRQIQSFESELGFKLFDNQRNRLRLTPAGRELVPLARNLISNARSVKSAAQSWSHGHIKRLHLGATSATISGLIAPFITTLNVDDPFILTHEAPHLGLHELLYTGLDMVVSPITPHHDCATVQIGLAPLRAYVHEHHPWAVEKLTMVTLAELAAQPLLLHSSSSVSRLELDLAITREALCYSSVEECDQSQTIQALAATGRGVGVVTDLPRYGLYGVLIQSSPRTPEVSLGITLHAAWDHQHYSTRTLESLAQRLKDFLLRIH